MLVNVPVTSYTRLLDFSENGYPSTFFNVSIHVVSTLYKRKYIALITKVFNTFYSASFENMKTLR